LRMGVPRVCFARWRRPALVTISSRRLGVPTRCRAARIVACRCGRRKAIVWSPTRRRRRCLTFNETVNLLRQVGCRGRSAAVPTTHRATGGATTIIGIAAAGQTIAFSKDRAGAGRSILGGCTTKGIPGRETTADVSSRIHTVGRWPHSGFRWLGGSKVTPRPGRWGTPQSAAHPAKAQCGPVQPSTASRTALLLDALPVALDDADRLGQQYIVEILGLRCTLGIQPY
jgi:hypothetical protein